MRRKLIIAVTAPTLLMCSYAVLAAKPVDLRNQPVSLLKPYLAVPATFKATTNAPGSENGEKLIEKSSATDFTGTTHIRVQQYYNGYPVWGGDAVVHVPASQKKIVRSLSGVPAASASTMNGTIYQDLNTDLANAPQQIFNAAQADKAKSKALELAKNEYGNSAAVVKKNQLMVYVDDSNKAHWVFLTQVYMERTGETKSTAAPAYILDAETFTVYQSWNEVKTMDAANGGGYGGNPKSGKLTYDGLPRNLGMLSIQRDNANRCHMKNTDVEIYDGRNGSRASIMSFNCVKPDSSHNNVYWNGSMDAVNSGYSPANDALFSGSVVQSLYQQWYKVPMLIKEDGSPMLLRMYAHYGDNFENAEWDSIKREIHLGDGGDDMYPLTSLSVVAHEVSHGFTSQHSDLIYANESGSMNESFSDMAAQASESFATGENTWQIGPEIFKNGGALRYMDQPSKDCASGMKAGSGCSIDSADEYAYMVSYGKEKFHLFGDRLQSYIVHLASGVYNRAFYLLAKSDGWNVRKAFEVMIYANSYYWTPSTNFKSGACDVMSSAKALKYDTAAVATAFSKVGINTSTC